MTAVQATAGIAAVLLAVWPQIKGLLSVKVGPSVPTYAKAISDLASVRARLAATGKLGEPQKAAIDTLTLALVDGSDS